MDSKTLLGAAIGAAVAIGGMAVAQHYSGRDARSATAMDTAAASPAAQDIGGTATPAAQEAGGASAEVGYAEVRSVHPVMERISAPRKVCEDVSVRRRAPGSDDHVVGTVVGAAVGGLLGNKLGHGRGRGAATVAGAVGGGFVGHEIGVRHDANRTVTTTEQRCHTVNDSSDTVTGYDVTYEHQGRSHTIRMDHDPGSAVQVDGRGVAVAPIAAEEQEPVSPR
jgi:uncharacterized protein YcfJ